MHLLYKAYNSDKNGIVNVVSKFKYLLKYFKYADN